MFDPKAYSFENYVVHLKTFQRDEVVEYICRFKLPVPRPSTCINRSHLLARNGIYMRRWILYD